MYIVVSFCNTLRKSGYYAKRTLSQLAVLDTETRNLYFLKTPRLVQCYGFTGVTSDDKYLYVVSQEAENPRIIRYQKDNLEKMVVATLKEVKDPHSMMIREGNLYVVSTGTNTIEKYDLDNFKYLGKYWQHPKTTRKSDQVHLNSIYEQNGQIWVSAFGHKVNGMWSKIEKGYVINTVNLEKKYHIEHPHSALNVDGHIYYCESKTGTVFQEGKEIRQIKQAYVRGLVVNDKYMAIGVSSGRKKSRSQKISNSAQEQGKFKSVNGVMLVKLSNNRGIFYNLSALFREIYDLHHVEWIKLGLPLGVEGIISVKPEAMVKENHLVSTLTEEKSALMKENAALRSQVNSLEEQARDKTEKVAEMERIAHEKQQALEAYQNTKGYRLLERVRKIKKMFI